MFLLTKMLFISAINHNEFKPQLPKYPARNIECLVDMFIFHCIADVYLCFRKGTIGQRRPQNENQKRCLIWYADTREQFQMRFGPQQK